MVADGERWEAVARDCLDQTHITLGRVGDPLRPAPAIDPKVRNATPSSPPRPVKSPRGCEDPPQDLGCGSRRPRGERTHDEPAEETPEGRPEGRAGGGGRLPRPAPGSGRGARPRAAADPGAARRLPRRSRAVPRGGARPPALVEAGRGLQGDRPEPGHGGAGGPGGGQELSAGGDRALVALHAADQPGDHHRARPSPGGLGALEGDPPGTSAPVRAGTPGQPQAQPRLGPSHRGLHLTPAAHREVGDRLGRAWASRRSTRKASAASMPASCSSSSTRPAASPRRSGRRSTAWPRHAWSWSATRSATTAISASSTTSP